MDSRAENNSTPSGNPVNADTLEPLLTLALGASEEVNTTSSSKDKSDKNSYMLRSKSFKTKESYTEDSVKGVFQTTPLNTPIIHPEPLCQTSDQSSSKENEISERVVPASNDELTHVILPEHLNLVQVQTVSESIANGNTEQTEGAETTTLPPGLVMIEQAVLEQISGILKNAAGAMAHDNIQKIITNTVTPGVQVTSSIQDQQTLVQSNTNEPTSETNVTKHNSNEDEWIDTKATALQLTDELRRYHIPQAVFARAVLNRSQGTLSDILRKPKPWNEMRLGKEIFRKMKEWLSLPEVKRIPQLRMEAAKDLDSRSKRPISRSEDIMQEGMGPKKVRRQFTETQKRALFAIFKETKKPSKEMQKALAEELGLDLNTVSNFFMNARRRYTSE